jgi:hypothetical protein
MIREPRSADCDAPLTKARGGASPGSGRRRGRAQHDSWQFETRPRLACSPLRYALRERRRAAAHDPRSRRIACESLHWPFRVSAIRSAFFYDAAKSSRWNFPRLRWPLLMLCAAFPIESMDSSAASSIFGRTTVHSPKSIFGSPSLSRDRADTTTAGSPWRYHRGVDRTAACPRSRGGGRLLDTPAAGTQRANLRTMHACVRNRLTYPFGARGTAANNGAATLGDRALAVALRVAGDISRTDREVNHTAGVASLRRL